MTLLTLYKFCLALWTFWSYARPYSYVCINQRIIIKITLIHDPVLFLSNCNVYNNRNHLIQYMSLKVLTISIRQQFYTNGFMWTYTNEQFSANCMISNILVFIWDWGFGFRMRCPSFGHVTWSSNIEIVSLYSYHRKIIDLYSEKKANT
jgi:hypothetical protein